VVVKVVKFNASFTINDDTLCLTDSLICTNTSTGDELTYLWDFGDDSTSQEMNPVHHYKEAGIYKVTLIISNENGCTDTAFTVVSMFALPVIDFHIDDSLLCVGEAAVITTNYTGTVKNVRWDFSDGSLLDQIEDVRHAFDKGGTFNIVMRAESIACGAIEKQSTVTVDVHSKVYLGEDTAICPNGTPVVLSDKFVNPAKKYKWGNGDSTQTLTVRHHGPYWVTATVGECSSTDTIEVHKSCYIDIPNAFTPNNDGVNDYFLPRVLLSRGLATFDMKIFNRWGQLIFETKTLDGRGWDGKFNGVSQFGGVFVYLIDVEFVNGMQEHYQGNVTLLR
jgi:gliding motility-associated-like protein